jgi:hypothetical protein
MGRVFGIKKLPRTLSIGNLYLQVLSDTRSFLIAQAKVCLQ